MNTLIVETSTDKPLIAFAQGKTLLYTRFLPPGIQSSRHLMPELSKAFKEMNLSPSSLRSIAVGVGPGSYTGIRVGVALAKGLAFSRSLPLIGLCSLEGFITPQDGPFASLIDAKVGGAYVLLREKQKNIFTQIESPAFVSKENLSTYVEGYTIVGPHTGYPDPDYLALAASQRQGSLDLELIYLRTPHYQR